MKAELTSVKNPRWANAEKTIIDCDITTSQFGDEVLPFTADSNDVEPHGRTMFANLIAGLYGEISEYVPQDDPPFVGVLDEQGNIQKSIL